MQLACREREGTQRGKGEEHRQHRGHTPAPPLPHSDVTEDLTESMALCSCFCLTMVSQTTVMTELSTKDMKRFLWRVIRWQLRLLQDNRNCQDCQDHQDQQKHQD